MDTYQQLIHKSRYARWDEETGKRESWEETVDRYLNFFSKQLTKKDTAYVREFLINLEVMPSMRSLWSAGDALATNNVAGYNCAFIAVDHPRAFDEALYILMSGTGLGFTVESQSVNKLPEISDDFHETDTVIVVRDSRTGWAKAYKEFLALLWSGQLPTVDYSQLRPAGARLTTMGGRSSGPDPLKQLFDFTRATFLAAGGRKLRPIEVHDIFCRIGEIVVVGGVRRSALISLSDLGDPEVRDAKSGQWWENYGHRALANNSAVYSDKPSAEVFLDEWTSLVRSKSGERGIFSRYGAQHLAPERRDGSLIVGTNPCAEISLRSGQFCNLTEVVCREKDNEFTLSNKIRVATILGTLQSTLTNFKYLRSLWKNNTEEERLLGVSLTGILDCKWLRNAKPEELERLKDVAIETNITWAKKLGVPQSTAITTIKPSGTVSQLVNSSSGIHARYSSYYIRTVRQDRKDPLTDFLVDAGVPHEPCVLNPDQTSIFSFPIASPKAAVVEEDVSAIEQLETWLKFKTYWAEHSVSVTVYVEDEEWMEVGAWVYDHFDQITGISFLPKSDHTYAQAPYQPISSEDYEEAFKAFPSQINFEDLVRYETEDNTEGAKTLACTGGSCEI